MLIKICSFSVMPHTPFIESAISIADTRRRGCHMKRIVDISTPQAKICVVRRLIRRSSLQLWFAYLRRDTANIALKYLEWKWGRKYETAYTDKDSIWNVSNAVALGREIDNCDGSDGG